MNTSTGALPAGWSITKLENLIDRISNGANAAQYSEPVGLPITRIETISDGVVDLSRVKYVRENDSDFRQRYALLDGDILFSHINSDPHLGKTAIYHERFGLLIHGINLLLIRPSRHFSSPFLHYQFQYLRNAGEFIAVAQRAVNQSSINQRTLKGFDVLVPPRNEQDRIVAEIEKQFTRLDAATAALKRVQANLKRYRASVLKAACEGRLVPTEAELARKEGRDYEPADKLLQRILRERRARWEADTLVKMTAAGKRPTDDRWKLRYKEPIRPDITDLPGLPEGWCWASADQITSLITDGEHITPERVTSGVYLLSARNVRDGRLSFDEVDYISKETHARLSLRLSILAGDVLLSCSGSVGRSCVVPVGVEFSLVRSVAVLKPVLVDSEYLCSAMRSGLIQDQIRRKSTQTAQANIFQGRIKGLVFPLPPLAEQSRIVPVCTNLLQGAIRFESAVVANAKRSSNLRRVILNDAFQGTLVPQDPSDEHASALLERIRAKRGAIAKPSSRRGRKELAHA